MSTEPSPDAINLEDVLAGGFINLIISETVSSEDVKILFDLSEPPSFSGPFLVWGELDAESGALNLFLAESTEDRTHPFAALNDFRSAIDRSGGVANGTGNLARSNKLPPDVNWTLNP